MYLGLKRGFVVAAISKVIYKFVRTQFVIVWVRANATEAKCKAKRDSAFGIYVEGGRMKQVNTGVCQ